MYSLVLPSTNTWTWSLPESVGPMSLLVVNFSVMGSSTFAPSLGAWIESVGLPAFPLEACESEPHPLSPRTVQARPVAVSILMYVATDPSFGAVACVTGNTEWLTERIRFSVNPFGPGVRIPHVGTFR